MGIAVGWSTNSNFDSTSMQNKCAAHCGISNVDGVVEKRGDRGGRSLWSKAKHSHMLQPVA